MISAAMRAGFANANIHATIRADVIQGDGEGLAGTMNTQALPVVLEDLAAIGRLRRGLSVSVAWDTRPPANLKAEAESLSAAAKAIDDCASVLERRGLQVDTKALAARFAVPIAGDLDGDGQPDDEAPQKSGPPPNLRLPFEIEAPSQEAA